MITRYICPNAGCKNQSIISSGSDSTETFVFVECAPCEVAAAVAAGSLTEAEAELILAD